MKHYCLPHFPVCPTGLHVFLEPFVLSALTSLSHKPWGTWPYSPGAQPGYSHRTPIPSYPLKPIVSSVINSFTGDCWTDKLASSLHMASWALPPEMDTCHMLSPSLPGDQSQRDSLLELESNSQIKWDRELETLQITLHQK